MKWQFVEKLKNPLDIFKVEEELGIKFPVDFIECVEKFNGGHPEKYSFDTDESKERVFNYLLSFNINEEKNILRTYEIIKSILGEKIVPIADDSFGNYICLNFSEHEKKYQVLFFDLNNKKVEKIAITFSEFLEKLY